jgi:dipeptidyl aminopeptidase/acylaminoacyl peptidase
MFLFQAQDDSTVAPEETQAFAARLQSQGKSIVFATVPTGNHYNSMIRQGISKAIDWLRHLEAQSSSQKEFVVTPEAGR